MPDRRLSPPIHTTPSDPFLLATESDILASVQLATSLNEWNLSQPRLITGVTSLSGSTRETSSKRHERAKAGGHSGNRRRVVTTVGVRNALCDAKPVTDDSMKAEQAIIESLQQGNLSVADEARAYEQLSSELGWTDDQIGRWVGKDRSTIRNLRNLLVLPPDVLELIGDGNGHLPQRSARKLVNLARIAPQAALSTAQQILGHPADTDAIVERAIQQYTVCIEHDWDLKWPAPSISTIDANGPIEIRACHRCPAFFKVARARYCTNPRCYAAKARLYISYELQRVSEATGIPIAAQDEAVTVLDITYHNKARASVWLRTDPSPVQLRLTARPSQPHNNWWHHQDLLGTGKVLLASTDPTLLDQHQKPSKLSKPMANAMRQRARRIEDEELALTRKARADVSWLVMNTARVLAPKIGISGGTLAYFAEFVNRHLSRSMNNWPEMQDFLATDRQVQPVVQNTSMAADLNLREQVLIKCLIDALQALDSHEMFDWPQALRQVEQIAAKFDLKLPDGWDRPPIHKTAANCWHCGRFTSLNRLTDRDKQQGWGIRQRGADLIDVYCPDCASKSSREKGRGSKHDDR